MPKRKKPKPEKCRVHQFYGKFDKCNSTDIVVEIRRKEGRAIKKYPICRVHWPKIAKSNIEWSST